MILHSDPGPDRFPGSTVAPTPRRRTLLEQIRRPFAAAGDWLLRTQLDNRLCEWANLTNEDDDA